MVDGLPQVLAVRPQADGVDIDIALQPDLPWFQGHFPRMPILPGVVQLDWAVYFARQQSVMDARAVPAFQVKFRALIRPDDALTLMLRRKGEANRVAFEFRRGAVVCSSGQLFGGDRS